MEAELRIPIYPTKNLFKDGRDLKDLIKNKDGFNNFNIYFILIRNNLTDPKNLFNDKSTSKT